MSIVDRITRFFGAKRQLMELEFDIQTAMRKPTREERHQAIGVVLRKHDPQRIEEIIGADGFLVTDGKTVRFDPVRKSP